MLGFFLQMSEIQSIFDTCAPSLFTLWVNTAARNSAFKEFFVLITTRTAIILITLGKPARVRPLHAFLKVLQKHLQHTCSKQEGGGSKAVWTMLKKLHFWNRVASLTIIIMVIILNMASNAMMMMMVMMEHLEHQVFHSWVTSHPEPNLWIVVNLFPFFDEILIQQIDLDSCKPYEALLYWMQCALFCFALQSLVILRSFLRWRHQLTPLGSSRLFASMAQA